jgi:hypothetical protein
MTPILPSPGLLRSVSWFTTDVPAPPIGSILNGQAVWTPEGYMCLIWNIICNLYLSVSRKFYFSFRLSIFWKFQKTSDRM